jgi:quercetin dioxygenase-like cupin family protein
LSIRAEDFVLFAGEEVKAGPVGHPVVFETDLVRAWEIVLDPGASLTWHRHRNPHVVITLDGADPVTGEGVGSVRYGEPGALQELVNAGFTHYRSRLIELNTWERTDDDESLVARGVLGRGRRPRPSTTGSGLAPPLPGDPAADPRPRAGRQDARRPVAQDAVAWRRNRCVHRTRAIPAGSGIPSRHTHASNQFMYCLSGRYTYVPTGITLTEGAFR